MGKESRAKYLAKNTLIFALGNFETNDLIQQFGIENHRINNSDQLEEVYALLEDKSRINEVVSKARTESVNYFERILGKTVR